MGVAHFLFSFIYPTGLAYTNTHMYIYYNKMMFLCSEQVYYYMIYKYTNVMTKLTLKLNCKLFTKVIKRPSIRSSGLDRQNVVIKREVQTLLI